jgi:hypothetical protein
VTAMALADEVAAQTNDPAVVIEPTDTAPEPAAEPPRAPPPVTAPVAGPPVIQRAGNHTVSAADAPPTFLTTDRFDTRTRLGLQAGFVTQDQVDDSYFLRLDLYGQYVLPSGHAGFYGEMPFSYAILSSDISAAIDADSGSGHGNLGLGAFFLPLGNDELVLRVGLMLPTASTDRVGGIAVGETSLLRLTDILAAAQNTTTARLSVSTVQRNADLFFRADAGLDLIIDKDSTASQDVFGRLNLAVGARFQPADLSVELATVAALDGDNSGDFTDRLLHTAALALHTRGEHQLHAGFVLPLDEALRGEVWMLALGYQHAL